MRVKLIVIVLILASLACTANVSVLIRSSAYEKKFNPARFIVDKRLFVSGGCAGTAVYSHCSSCFPDTCFHVHHCCLNAHTPGNGITAPN